MKTKLLLGIALGACVTTLALNAQTDLKSMHNALDQWVQTKQLTSKEQSDWRIEKSILSDTQKLLSSELERLNASLEDLKSSATAADEDRSKLTASKEAFAEASAVVEDSINELETHMKRVVKTLPTPLIEKIKPLIRRLPDDSNNTKLSIGERVQNIVGILSQADKFNSTITQTSESRELDGDKVIEVRTLYWGLSMAYYVDAAGEYAGIGFPGEDGWEWPQIEGAGPQIKKLLDVYEGSEEIQFVEVPARIN
jgi:archaellum component FlaC